MVYNEIGTQTFGLLIKVSNQMEVIGRHIPRALNVMESFIAIFVIIVSLIANDGLVRLCRLLWASQTTGHR